MIFSEKAWGEIAPIYAAILDHPFIRELAAGTLSKERFQFYMIQDALYLTEFSHVLSVVADRATDPDTKIQFDTSAQNVLIVERALHETFFREFGITGDAIADAEMSSTCFSYTNYLLATAERSPLEVAVAAVLPCFWIYWEVGKHVRSEAMASNPYRLWIETYGDQGFGERVRNVIATADAMAASGAPGSLEGMMRAFRRASQLEWMFWDSAYRREMWPV